MKTREFGVSSKLVASVLAGSIAFLNGGGASLVATANAKAPPAAAPPVKAPTLADAKKHYANGEKKYNDKDFAGALAEFQDADSIKPAPQAARYIGLCQEQLGHPIEAVGAYERFLEAVPTGMDAAADDLKSRVARLKALPGKLHIESTPAGASVTVDGKPLPAPTPTDVEAPPGAHTVKFVLDKFEPKEVNVDVKFASPVDVKESLTAKPPEPPPPPPVAVAPPPPAATVAVAPPAPPPPVVRSMVPAIITGGLAVAAAGVGVAFGVMALGDKSDYDKNPTVSKADDGDNHALVADMAYFVAITLGVTSAVLFFTKDEAPASAALSAPKVGAQTPKKKHAYTITPLPIVTPTGGGVGALVRF